MEIPNDLKALLATMKLEGNEPEWKFTASSNQVTVQLIWIKAKDLDTRNPKLVLQRKQKPPSTRRRNAQRFTQWMDSKKAVASATTHEPNNSTNVDNIFQAQARDTVIGIPLTPTKYRGEPTSRRTLSPVNITPIKHAIANTSILHPNLEVSVVG
ncbi:unnamed protein product [Mytilus coruscus]|uniref:Uncharacterized protein n=1 Tax=Mytilus coruscus TaxID=42192 RepID=A0A6J8DNI8_MYTCO|nr:unnamed protein product [Mytilus coruscus]